MHVTFTVTNKSADSTLTKCTINGNCTGISLYMCRGQLTKSQTPRYISISMTYYIKQFSPVFTQLNQSSSTSITASLEDKCRISHTVLGFIYNQNLDFKYGPSQFDSGYVVSENNEIRNTPDALPLIKNI